VLYVVGTACLPVPPSLRGINYPLCAMALGELRESSGEAPIHHTQGLAVASWLLQR